MLVGNEYYGIGVVLITAQVGFLYIGGSSLIPRPYSQIFNVARSSRACVEKIGESGDKVVRALIRFVFNFSMPHKWVLTSHA